jgi:predicted metal-dependent peptidase
MNDTTASILDELAQTSIDLQLEEPFYAHLLTHINKEVVRKGHEVDTLAVGMGTTGTFTLYVNADFWQHTLTSPAHRRGVLKHEMLHLIFRHLYIREPGLDPMLLNVALDLVVNQFVRRSDLPDDSIFLETFADLHLERDQTWFYYYSSIEQIRRGTGGGQGRQTDADPLQNIKADQHGLERHQPWRAVANRSELEQAVLDTHLDSLLRTAHQRTGAAAWGQLPSSVQEAIQARWSGQTSKVAWRQVLRMFAASVRSNRLRTTLRRPSKRYGTTPGLRVQRQQRLLVAVDTSGSVGQPEFQLIFSELYHLWRTGVQIEVIECDTAVQRRYAYKGSTPPYVQGRGGTDFTEPMRLANNERPDALIYCTDGFAGPPKATPLVPVLWLITPNGIQPDHVQWRYLPGRKVKVG